MKKPILRAVTVLLVMALVLCAVNFGLRGFADKTARRVELFMFRTMVPGSQSFAEELYTGNDPSIRAVHKGETGFVVEVATEGYADEIVMLVGVSNSGSVTGITVKDMHETWTLGMSALYDWQYLAQYLGTEGKAQVGSDVDALTGATVTSKAITRCVNSAVAVVTGADAESGATSWGG